MGNAAEFNVNGYMSGFLAGVWGVRRWPQFWAVAFLGWFLTLWWLSDGPIPVREGPEIPYVDKVLHFGYFFGGGGLLSAAVYRWFPRGFGRWFVWPLSVVLLAGVGALDEWHQSWVPERSGNDVGDWLADVCGGLAGCLVFRLFRGFLD